VTQAVVIKSKSYGIHLVLNPELDFDELIRAVILKFQEAGDFFKNAKVGISFEGYRLTAKQEYELISAIEEYTDIKVLCIMEEERVRETWLVAKAEALMQDQVMEGAVIHAGPLAPGQHLHSDTGLVIIGDVPKGANVTAGGNIVIFGTLEGLAQAGLYGDSAAFIAALSIDTGQLQIGKLLLVPQNKGGRTGFLHKNKKKKNEFSPQIARVRDGHVIMEPYTKDL